MRTRSLFVVALLTVTACDDSLVEPRAPATDHDATGHSAAAVAPLACTKTWADGSGGLWSDPSRWIPYGVPSITDHACIDAPGRYDVTATTQIFVDYLEIGGEGATVNFEYDPPFGVGINARDRFDVADGSTLTVLSEGAVPLTGGTFDNRGTIRIVNQCACGGDVVVMDFSYITNHGRMELAAPMTIETAGAFFNMSSGIVVTSGSGVIDATASAMSLHGSVLGSTRMHVGSLTWYSGTVGTTAADTAVVLVRGGRVEFVGPSAGYVTGARLDAVTNGGNLEVTGSVPSAVRLHVIALRDDALHFSAITVNSTQRIDGTVTIIAHGNNTLDFGTLSNHGLLEIVGGTLGSRDVMEMTGNFFNNEGLIELRRTDLSFTNSGTFQNLGDVAGPAPDRTTITMGPGTELWALRGGDIAIPVLLDGATLLGNGKVGRVTALGATIEPGHPYGTLQAFDLDLDDASEVVIHIRDRPSATQAWYGQLHVLSGPIALAGTFRVASIAFGQLGRCGDVIAPIKYDNDTPQGAFSSFAGLNVGPGSNWRVTTTPDSLMLAGYDPDAQQITVTRGSFALTEGGTADLYHLCLGPTLPQANVLVTPVTANGQVVVTGATRFDQSNWKLPKTLTIDALDDAVVEPTHNDVVRYSLASANPSYTGLAAQSNPVTITDDDGNTDLEIVLQNAPATATVGTTIEVIYRVTNHGPTLATGATLTVDPLGGTNLSFQEAFGGTCTEDAAGVLTCDVGGLASGAQLSVAIVYQTTAAGDVTLEATVVSEQPDPSSANDQVVAGFIVN